MLSEVVHPDLDCTARVDRAVAAHRTARRLVGPHSRSGVVEGPNLVGCGVQDTVVVGGDVSEGGEGTTVD